MKKLTIICLLSLVACKKKTTSTPSPSNPNPTPVVAYYDVPNWKDDTLIGIIQQSSTFRKDTIYSLSISGHSYIKYKGNQYQVKAYTILNASFEPASDVYFVDLYDMNGKPVNDTTKMNCAAYPYKYYDSSFSKWKDQPQAIMVNTPPFNDSVPGSIYSTLYK